ncbi:class II glutamine amidotransferase [Cloacibacillus evryensis]|uniref:Glutamine amidotransferase family protein n=1 Tax=Cloacibacillus evryensis TaxID=508460 RepID=A0AAW5K7K1_9BACT|nr:glutamine amidotransferase family protein [Cloacibacillus evryensis]MCQ4815731.1 glutamine amidotransferase family protein [Cloacibacillus evryensis]
MAGEGIGGQREGAFRNLSGCAICAIFERSGGGISGGDIIRSIAVMHDRSNGLGGGFAGYGIYPQYKELYAFHVFYDDPQAKSECERYLDSYFDVVNLSKIPIRRSSKITDVPMIWRYFLRPLKTKLEEYMVGEDDYTCRRVISINTKIRGAYVFSSGKNMGIFKGVGFPEDIGEFYRLEEYEGYGWTAHGRYPTNTPGWWGGAHPFGLLNYSVVHNGEISSYDANRRFIEMFGYRCNLQTDTEVITYIIDYLCRKQGLTLEEMSAVIAAPFWSTIERMPPEKARLHSYLRNLYSNLLVTGPFSIVLGFDGGLMALNDRLKLRSLVTAELGTRVFIASEEAAIRAVAPDAGGVYAPKGGEPFIVRLEGGAA